MINESITIELLLELLKTIKARRKGYKNMIKELENQQELLKKLYVSQGLILNDLDFKEVD